MNMIMNFEYSYLNLTNKKIVESAGDQQVRHAGEIDHHRRATDVLAEHQRQRAARPLQRLGRQQFAQADQSTRAGRWAARCR